MKRLGYTSYVAQGGDWGAVITDLMGVQAPPGLLGIHTNMAGVVPADIRRGGLLRSAGASGLSADEKLAYERLQFVYQKGSATAYQMGLRPQTLYGIADSPVGLAAYFLDHDARSYELIARVFRRTVRRPYARRRPRQHHAHLVDEHGDFWRPSLLGDTGASRYFNAKGVTIPVAVSVFPDELYPAPRSWAEQAYPKLIHYNKLAKGGHFAAWEQPKLFSEEMRAGFRSLRIASEAVARVAQPVGSSSSRSLSTLNRIRLRRSHETCETSATQQARMQPTRPRFVRFV